MNGIDFDYKQMDCGKILNIYIYHKYVSEIKHSMQATNYI